LKQIKEQAELQQLLIRQKIAASDETQQKKRSHPDTGISNEEPEESQEDQYLRI
jgi:hypothetical protein